MSTARLAKELQTTHWLIMEMKEITFTLGKYSSTSSCSNVISFYRLWSLWCQFTEKILTTYLNFWYSLFLWCDVFYVVGLLVDDFLNEQPVFILFPSINLIILLHLVSIKYCIPIYYSDPFIKTICLCLRIHSFFRLLSVFRYTHYTLTVLYFNYTLETRPIQFQIVYTIIIYLYLQLCYIKIDLKSVQKWDHITMLVWYGW